MTVSQRSGYLAVAVAFAFLVAACGAPAPGLDGTLPETSPLSPATSTPVGGAQSPTSTPDVTGAREENPRRFGAPPGYLFDVILPIYDPEFVSAEQAPLNDDELVMGVEIDGEAKAYPITVMRSREMVNDELGGIPILVTW